MPLPMLSFLLELLHSLHIPANSFLLGFPINLRLSLTSSRKPPQHPAPTSLLGKPLTWTSCYPRLLSLYVSD